MNQHQHESPRHRRSIRLQGYDYSRAGAYFITLCAQNRACVFGNIVDGVVQLNDIGEMIQSVWQDMPTHYLGVSVDEFIVMPNHFHGIIILVPDPVGAGPRACPDETTATPPQGEAIAPGRPRGAAPTLSLPDVVQRLKSMITARYRHGVAQYGWPSFPGRLWQRNYYEHVIRDEGDLLNIREYIVHNATTWGTDPENPARSTRKAT